MPSALLERPALTWKQRGMPIEHAHEGRWQSLRLLSLVMATYLAKKRRSNRIT